MRNDIVLESNKVLSIYYTALKGWLARMKNTSAIIFKCKVCIVSCILYMANLILKICNKLLFFALPKDIKNICIYRIANIGDTITAVPAMYEIRKKYPRANITLLTSPGKEGALGAKDVLQNTKWIDKIIAYYSIDIKRKKELTLLVKNLRDLKIDYFIQLPTENTSFKTMLRNMFFAKTLGAKFASGFYISTINLFAKTQNKYKNYPTDCERLLNGLPWKTTDKIEFPIEYTKEDYVTIEETLKKYGVSERDKTLAISFYGKGDAQNWSIKSFSAIADLWEKKGGKVLVLGGKQQFIDGNNIIKNLSKQNGINLCGQLSLPQSVLFLKNVKLLVTVDTGTAHMASVTKTPCVEIFSSYYIRDKWVAYGENISVIRKELDCSPCMSKICKYGCPAKCMGAISVDEVWNRMSSIIVENRM